MECYFTGVPGIKVVAVSNAYDAKGVLKAAVHDDNPVLMLEHKLLYGSKGPRSESGTFDGVSKIPDEDFVLPLDQAAVRRKGTHVTLLGWLLMSHFAALTAEQLADEGIDTEVIDVRSLIPFDYETIHTSVQKTGRAVNYRRRPENRWD